MRGGGGKTTTTTQSNTNAKNSATRKNAVTNHTPKRK